MTTKTLNARQKAFVREYLVDNNAAQAAIRAGYSAKAASQTGSRLMADVKIKAAIDHELSKLASEATDRRERILRELERIAFATPADVAKWGPNGVVLLESDTLTPDQLAAVASVSSRETKDSLSYSFKMHDKLGALMALAKLLGLMVDKSEVSGPDGGPLKVMPVDPAEVARALIEQKREETGD